MKQNTSKRVYEAPAMLNSSRFERRGILASCCLTSGDDCKDANIDAEEGLCVGGTGDGQPRAQAQSS